MNSLAHHLMLFGCVVIASSENAFAQDNYTQNVRLSDTVVADSDAFRCALDLATSTQCVERLVHRAHRAEASGLATRNIGHAVDLLLRVGQITEARNALTDVLAHEPMNEHSQRAVWTAVERWVLQCRDHAARVETDPQELRRCEAQLRAMVHSMGLPLTPDVYTAAATLRGQLLLEMGDRAHAWQSYRAAVVGWDAIATYQLDSHGAVLAIKRGGSLLDHDLPRALPTLGHGILRPGHYRVFETFQLVRHIAWSEEPTEAMDGLSEIPLQLGLSGDAWNRGRAASARAWLALGTMFVSRMWETMPLPWFQREYRRSNGYREGGFERWVQRTLMPYLGAVLGMTDGPVPRYFQRAIAAQIAGVSFAATAQLAAYYMLVAIILREAPIPYHRDPHRAVY